MRVQNIYVDYSATTPVDPLVAQVVLPFLNTQFGNPSSNNHIFGWEAKEAIDLAREQVADLVNVYPQEIYFTSGATEAINLALFGCFESYKTKGNHIITACTEHKVVLDCCQELERRGASITYLAVNQYGEVDLKELRKSITKETILISLMHANNEIGSIHPIQEIAQIAKKAEVLFMTDCTQSVGKIPVKLNLVDIGVFSSHKMYGPKGAGALYVKKGVKLAPQLFGGGQEKTLRPGTQNVPAIVGFGKAAELVEQKLAEESAQALSFRNKLDFGWNVGTLSIKIVK